VDIYKIPEIKIGAARLDGVRMIAEQGIVPKGADAYFDGVLGYAVFKGVLLTLDYPNKQVILTPGGMSEDDKKSAIPYELEHGIPFVQVQIGSVKVGAHIDSGADGGLSIPAKFQKDLDFAGEPHKVGEGRTLFNTVDIYAAKVKDPVMVEGFRLPIDEIELNDLFPVANLGGRVLHLFRVVIDQTDQRILFSKH
jgi:hypothetical protein